MSATIYWQPLSCKTDTIAVMAPSAFIEAMRRAFGEPTWVLNKHNLDTLTGMEAVWKSEPEWNPFTQLIKHIKTHDAIEINIS